MPLLHGWPNEKTWLKVTTDGNGVASYDITSPRAYCAWANAPTFGDDKRTIRAVYAELSFLTCFAGRQDVFLRWSSGDEIW